MAILPQIIFNLRSNSSNFQRIECSVTNPLIGSGSENIYYRVTSPSGVILKDIDYNSIDGTISSPSMSVNMPLVTLPFVSGGDIEEGKYVFLFQVEDTGNTGTYTDVPVSVDVDFRTQGKDTCVKRGLIEFVVDCFCLNLTVTDQTDYSDVTFISRTLSVVPPTIPNQPAPTTVTTTTPSIDLTFEYSGVNYDANLFSIFEQRVAPDQARIPDITISESIQVTQRQKIICDHNLCKLMECIEAFFRKTTIEASKYGGIQNLPFEKLSKWLEIENLLARYNAATLCQNTTLLDFYYRRLQEITGCDCGCNDPSSDEIVRLTPVCGGSGGTSNIVGVSPILAPTVSGTTTLSLVPSFTNLVVNGASELEVNTQDNSVDYLTVARDATIPTKWIVSFDETALRYENYVVSTDATVSAAIFGVTVSNTPFPLRYAINSFLNTLKIDGTFRVASNTIGVPICLFNPQAASPILIPTPASARSGPAFACMDSVGRCVGSLQMGNTGTSRQLIFTANNNYIVGSIISVNGTLNLD